MDSDGNKYILIQTYSSDMLFRFMRENNTLGCYTNAIFDVDYEMSDGLLTFDSV